MGPIDSLQGTDAWVTSFEQSTDCLLPEDRQVSSSKESIRTSSATEIDSLVQLTISLVCPLLESEK